MQLFTTCVSRFFLGSALLLSISAANAALIKSYDFNGDLSDTLGNGLDLVASGGSVGSGRYSFDHNQGLSLTSALTDTADYGIEIRFQGNDFGDFHKVIDFQGLASEFGLYIGDYAVYFWDSSIWGAGSITNSIEDFTLGLSRSGGLFEFFLDGVSIPNDPPADGGPPYIPEDPSGIGISEFNILNFFEDDLAGDNQDESFAGSVDWIRIHDDSSTFGDEPISAVPVPAALWLFGTALIGLIGFGKRKARVAA
jgi:hypothetical protein